MHISHAGRPGSTCQWRGLSTIENDRHTSEFQWPDGIHAVFVFGSRPALGLKAISVFHNNASIGKDIHQGVVLLLDPETGELLAMINDSSITAIRTAAVSAVATNLLAREDACNLAIADRRSGLLPSFRNVPSAIDKGVSRG